MIENDLGPRCMFFLNQEGKAQLYIKEYDQT